MYIFYVMRGTGHPKSDSHPHTRTNLFSTHPGCENHIAALAGAFGVRKNEKVCAFQYFQNFNFKKLENPEPFVRSEAQAFKKKHPQMK